MVGQDCPTYLVHVRDVKGKSPFTNSIPIVYKFKKVFPMDLPSMSPDRDIDSALI